MMITSMYLQTVILQICLPQRYLFFGGERECLKFPGVRFALLNMYLVLFGEGAQQCPPYVEHRSLKKNVFPELFLYR